MMLIYPPSRIPKLRKADGPAEPLRPLLNRLRRHHRYEGAAALGDMKIHRAADLGKYRVIAAHAHAVTGMHGRTALADEDVAGDHSLAAEFLHAEASSSGVASVAG